MKRIIFVLFLTLLVGGDVRADKGEGESNISSLTSLPPFTPLLDSPMNEAINLPDTITCNWHSQIHSAMYRLQVSMSQDFSPPIIDQANLTDTLFTTSQLEKNTTYYWRVSASNVAGEGVFSEAWSFTTSTTTAVDGKIGSIPQNYALLPAYPNPFNPMTTITYHLPEKAEVSLVIYNSMGQTLKKLVSGQRQAGEYRVMWDGRDNSGTPVSSGLYICHFTTGSHEFAQKILLIR